MAGSRTALALAALTALAPAVPCTARAQGPASSDLAIRGVTVVDVERGVLLPGRTVLVRGDRIAAVGATASTPIPAGARVVDGAGGFLIPGLWDAHGHIAHRMSWAAPLNVANGITAVRDMATNRPLAELRKLKAEVLAGRVVSPRFLAAGPLVDGEPRVFPDYLAVGTAERARAVVDSLAAEGADVIKVYTRLTREQLVAILDQAKRRGLRVVGHVPLAVRTSEASDLGMWSVEHAFRHRMACATAEDEIRTLLLAQIDAQTRKEWGRYQALEDSAFTLGVRTYDAARCQALGRTFARNGTWFVPTLVEMRSRFRPETPYDPGFDSLFMDPRLRFLPPRIVTWWRDELAFSSGRREGKITSEAEWEAMTRERASEVETRLRMVADLHRAGAGILAGTDASEAFAFVMPGFSLHEELALFVKAGLTPTEALRTATLNPARFLGMADSLGTVAPGKLADLVLLDANPLDDIRNTTRIRAVVLNGRPFDRAALDAVLEDAARAAQQDR